MGDDDETKRASNCVSEMAFGAVGMKVDEVIQNPDYDYAPSTR